MPISGPRAKISSNGCIHVTQMPLALAFIWSFGLEKSWADKCLLLREEVADLIMPKR